MTDQELIRALRCCVSSPRLDKCREECVFCDGPTMGGCIPKMGQAVADRLTAVLGELERVTRERDAAVESWRGFCAKGMWNGKQYLSDGQMDARCETCREGGKCNWQWRGPKETETCKRYQYAGSAST